MKYFLSILGLIFCFSSFSQNKKALRAEVAKLTQEKKNLQDSIGQEQNEKKSLKTTLDRFSNIVVDDVITPEEQPKDIVIGENGWRVDLNGGKYKSDIIGQLGTIWILDTNNQLQPQGAIKLSDYKIEPLIISNDDDLLYKKFISKVTSLKGHGGAPFAKITSGLNHNQFASFSISIDGTSLIKPLFEDLRKISKEVDELFTLPYAKATYLCTGMHVVRYYSRTYSKSEGDGKISSPVVNIDGSFYAENSEEAKEYFVARQLTQIFKSVTTKDVTGLISEINSAILTQSNSDLEKASMNYTPPETLSYFLERKPNTEEIIEYQEKPIEYIEKISRVKSDNEKTSHFLRGVTKKISKLPDSIFMKLKL